MFNVIITGRPGAFKGSLIDAKANVHIITILRPTREEIVSEIEDLTTDL